MHSRHSAAGSLLLVVDAQAAANVQELEVKALREEAAIAMLSCMVMSCGTCRQQGTQLNRKLKLVQMDGLPTCARICLMKSTMSSVASRKMLTCTEPNQGKQTALICAAAGSMSSTGNRGTS